MATYLSDVGVCTPGGRELATIRFASMDKTHLSLQFDYNFTALIRVIALILGAQAASKLQNSTQEELHAAVAARVLARRHASYLG